MTFLAVAHVTIQSNSSKAICQISKCLKRDLDVIKSNWCKWIFEAWVTCFLCCADFDFGFPLWVFFSVSLWTGQTMPLKRSAWTRREGWPELFFGAGKGNIIHMATQTWEWTCNGCTFHASHHLSLLKIKCIWAPKRTPISSLLWHSFHKGLGKQTPTNSSRCFVLVRWPKPSFSLLIFSRINKDENRKMECIERKRKAE